MTTDMTTDVHGATGVRASAWALPQASPKRVWIAVSLVALNVLDVLLTKVLLGLGGLEANPAMQGLMEGFAAPLAVKTTVALMAAALLLCCPPRAKLGERAALAVLAYYGFVTVWNLVMLTILLGR